MNSEIVNLPNGRRWQVYSGGDGPQLLWLHGLRGVDPADPMLAALQTRYRVTAPVAPGFNDLDELSRIDNIHELALDYDDLIDASGPERFHPDRPFVRRDDRGRDRGAFSEARRTAGAAGAVRSVERRLSGRPTCSRFPTRRSTTFSGTIRKPARRSPGRSSTDADVKVVAAQMVKLAQSLTAVTKFVWPIPDRGLRRRLPRIACPTLVLFGADDAVVSSRYADDFKAGLRDGADGGGGRRRPHAAL